MKWLLVLLAFSGSALAQSTLDAVKSRGHLQ